ncbi:MULTISPECIES: hypothetical protein [Bradyrhizobium]|uniref:hypothetical protein n=1 Tax=Bradyrhizobium TaxID=374 RepID=UPI00293F3B96|nr:hypothetical protein [Bradyrhizobium sp. NDS-1]WOH73123.1 hypothetical protein RX330_33480 [Bradyrhizobium sp. NDS-1]
MTDLESLILTEANRQGCQPDQHAIRQAGVDLAGAILTSQGLIHLPGLGAISVADFTRSLRARMPKAFSTIDDGKPEAALTVSELRRKRPLDAAWRARLASATGITKSMMDEIATRREGKGN